MSRRRPGLGLLLAPLFGGLVALGARAAPEALPEGPYVLVVQVVADTEVPVLGTVRSETRSLFRLDVRREGERLWATQKVCDVELDSDQRVARTVFPDRLVRALPSRRLPLELTPDEGGTRLKVDLGADALGYDPARTGGRMPRSPDAPGLVDLDRDARPGVTIFLDVVGVGRFPLAVVSRSHTLLEGRVVAPGRAEGTARLVEHRQRVLDGLPVPGAIREVRGAPERSRFRLSRLPRALACEELRLGAAGLAFERAPRPSPAPKRPRSPRGAP